MFVQTVLICIIAMIVGLITVYQVPSTTMHTLSMHNTTVSAVIRKDGVIFISDGAKGVAREASIELAKLGFHVLVGVKSEDEKRSFAFESRKGLEIILFDISDPTTLVKVVYRLREIKRDLARPVIGVVLNLGDFIEDHLEEKHIVDIELLDINYKAMVKGPLRLLQSMLELVKYQRIEDDERASSRIHEHSRMISSGGEQQVRLERGAGPTNTSRVSPPLDGEGIRVVVLTADLDTTCGSKCVLQDTFVDLIDSLRSDRNGVTNITLSTVHSLYRPAAAALTSGQDDTLGRVKGPSIRNTRYRRGGTQAAKEKVYGQQLLAARLKIVERYVLDKMGRKARGMSGDSLEVDLTDGGKKYQQLSFSARALVHSFASPRPQFHYEEQ